jgi:hypothetical protein
MTADSLTVLHSVHRKHAAKQFTLVKGKKGSPDTIRNKNYGSERYFRVEEIAISNATELNAALDRLTHNPFAFIIRGAPLRNINRSHTRRLSHKDPKTGDPATFESMPRRWLSVDLDHLTAPPLTDVINYPVDAVHHAISLLPPEFRDITCFWQFSSSQGLPGSENFLSPHLWYWGAQFYSDDELTRWANFVNRDGRLVDAALFRTVQAHHIAAPLFFNLDDPLPLRHGVWSGLEDELKLIIPPPDAKDPTNVSSEGYEPGIGVRAFLAQIGGPHGFRRPTFQAISSYIAIHGSRADLQPLYAKIR